jgi:glutamine synthetase
LWFTDVLGNLKSFAISPAELENALEDGMTFDGSSIDGFSRVQESDVLAIPDPNTFVIVQADQGHGLQVGSPGLQRKISRQSAGYLQMDP